jgi:hypothetical protein
LGRISVEFNQSGPGPSPSTFGHREAFKNIARCPSRRREPPRSKDHSSRCLAIRGYASGH